MLGGGLSWERHVERPVGSKDFTGGFGGGMRVKGPDCFVRGLVRSRIRTLGWVLCSVDALAVHLHGFITYLRLECSSFRLRLSIGLQARCDLPSPGTKGESGWESSRVSPHHTCICTNTEDPTDRHLLTQSSEWSRIRDSIHEQPTYRRCSKLITTEQRSDK